MKTVGVGSELPGDPTVLKEDFQKMAGSGRTRRRVSSRA